MSKIFKHHWKQLSLIYSHSQMLPLHSRNYILYSRLKKNQLQNLNTFIQEIVLSLDISQILSIKAASEIS